MDCYCTAAASECGLWHQFSEAHAECACSCTSSFLYFFHYSPPSTKVLMHYPARSIVYCHSGSWMGWRTWATAGIVDAILANATPPSSSPLIHGTATIVGYCLRMNASSAYSGLRPTQAEFAYMSYWMVVSYLHDVRQNTRISGILLGRTGSCSFCLLWVEKNFISWQISLKISRLRCSGKRNVSTRNDKLLIYRMRRICITSKNMLRLERK